jgi:hypothetical protein
LAPENLKIGFPWGWGAVGGCFCRVAPSGFERESAQMGLTHTRECARL